MRHHRRVLKVKFICVGLAVVALTAAGCGEATETGNATIDARSKTDAAYEAVASVQVANALAYSNAILKTTTDPQIKSFAQEVVTERNTVEDILKRLRKVGAPMDVKKASYQLDVSLKDLAITADGKPLAVPAEDAAYIKAMRSNLEGTFTAAAAHQNKGGPGTSQLSARLQGSATHELEQLKALNK
jgi:predicted outer membrane protein